MLHPSLLAYITAVGVRSITAKEADDMVALVDWLGTRPNLLWCHVPNGGARHIATAARLKREGVMKGVPDLLIFTPPKILPPDENVSVSYVGTALELKRQYGGRVSAEQAIWLERLQELGWHCIVANGLESAVNQLVRAGY